MSLRNMDGDALRIDAETQMDFAAWPFTQQDLYLTAHYAELPRRDTITFCVGRIRPESATVGEGMPTSASPSGSKRLQSA